MKGYNTSNGYMGYVEGKYILFASEQEYFEFMHYRGYIYVILELILSKSIELNIAEHYLRIKDRFSVLPVEFIQK